MSNIGKNRKPDIHDLIKVETPIRHLNQEDVKHFLSEYKNTFRITSRKFYDKSQTVTSLDSMKNEAFNEGMVYVLREVLKRLGQFNALYTVETDVIDELQALYSSLAFDPLFAVKKKDEEKN